MTTPTRIPDTRAILRDAALPGVRVNARRPATLLLRVTPVTATGQLLGPAASDTRE